MHKEFLKLLENATGRSEHVIVVNLDIRGFTSFCQTVNPLDVATSIKKVYLTILNNYFKKHIIL
jgi:GTP cyclohydrolase III